jgi:hypothetical protein
VGVRVVALVGVGGGVGMGMPSLWSRPHHYGISSKCRPGSPWRSTASLKEESAKVRLMISCGSRKM